MVPIAGERARAGPRALIVPFPQLGPDVPQLQRGRPQVTLTTARRTPWERAVPSSLIPPLRGAQRQDLRGENIKEEVRGVEKSRTKEERYQCKGMLVI